ncbi:MAG: crotonase/enoyl-CoA hydratase family protein [Spirochaetes bacterium]|nr:crotonase/enoyl-CoA hydratase family protein [Spirochaetota bacterium]
MAEQKITVEVKDHVLAIGINRPEKRNAFDLDMFFELGLAYGRLHSDPELRCGVLFAHGDHFTAGLDLVKWAPAFADGKFPEVPAGALNPMGFDDDARVCKPIVMAVQGICFTIGLELLLATDVRVAARNVRFGQIEIKRGIYPVGGGTFRLPKEIGWGNAMRYLLTAEEINAEDAYRLGLVQELVDPGQELGRAMEIAGIIASRAPLGVQATLKSARISNIQGDKAAFDRLLPDLLPIMKSEDAAEGIKAFMERREANFKGK